MTSREDVYELLENIVLSEFPEIVIGTETVEGKLRLFISDGSFMDVWLSEKKVGVYVSTGALEEVLFQ